MTNRVGQVWEVFKYRDVPPLVLLFITALQDDGYVARYRTFDLLSGESDIFEEYYHYPLEAHKKWTRID